jgi:hypothetical protein
MRTEATSLQRSSQQNSHQSVGATQSRSNTPMRDGIEKVGKCMIGHRNSFERNLEGLAKPLTSRMWSYPGSKEITLYHSIILGFCNSIKE